MHFIITFIIGAALGCVIGRIQNIDLYSENAKLRKENQLLWRRLQDEGKIDKF
jgi:hypothetical protein